MKLEELVNANYEKLNDTDLVIWSYISGHRKECEKLTIDQLARQACASRTSVMRFVRKLALSGYSELKVLLRMDNAQPQAASGMMEQVCGIYGDLIHMMQVTDFTEIFRMIDRARRLYVYGAGMLQTAVQRELKRIFLTADKVFFDINGLDESRMMAGLISQEDLAVIISVSGESQPVLDFAKTLKVRDVPFISITKRNENTLARMSNHNLYVTTETFRLFYGGIDYETVTSYFMLVELLFLKYIEYRESGGRSTHETGGTDQPKL